MYIFSILKINKKLNKNRYIMLRIALHRFHCTNNVDLDFIRFFDETLSWYLFRSYRFVGHIFSYKSMRSKTI